MQILVNSDEKRISTISEAKKEERIAFIMEKSNGIIREERMNAWKTIVENDTDNYTHIHGLHAEHALIIIAFLNNMENSIKEAVSMFRNQFHNSSYDEAKTLDIVKRMSDRGLKFYEEVCSSNRVVISQSFERFDRDYAKPLGMKR